MTKRYYAASLKGDEAKAIDNVFYFDSESLRQEWLSEGSIECVTLYSKTVTKRLLKTHPPVHVTMELVGIFGTDTRGWYYHPNVNDTLTQESLTIEQD